MKVCNVALVGLPRFASGATVWSAKKYGVGGANRRRNRRIDKRVRQAELLWGGILRGPVSGRGWARLYPSRRQIIVRSDERIGQITLGRAVQGVLVLVLLLAVGWSAFVSERFVRHEAVVAALKAEQAVTAERAEQERRAALAAAERAHRGRLARKECRDSRGHHSDGE